MQNREMMTRCNTIKQFETLMCVQLIKSNYNSAMDQAKMVSSRLFLVRMVPGLCCASG